MRKDEDQDTHNSDIPDNRPRSFLTHAVNTPSPADAGLVRYGRCASTDSMTWMMNCCRDRGCCAMRSINCCNFDAGPRLAALDQSGKDAIERGEKKIFTSADDHVEDLANKIDNAWGNVVGTNVNIRTADGALVTDADILLENGVVQVKSGTGKGMADQLRRTEEATGLPALGYTPDAGKHVLKNSCTTNCAETLIKAVEP
jgi:hypothetical protein